MKTESQNSLGRTMWLVVLALALAAIVLALFADVPSAIWINMHSPAWLKKLATIVSRVGDWPAHIAAGVVGVTLALSLQRQSWTRIFLAMLVACALAGIVARVTKVATGRARPSVQTENAWNGPQLGARYNAFPSGHTASSAAFFLPLALARKRFGLFFLAIPLLIGIARVIAGAHYLSDVVFAMALGLACALLTCRVIRLSEPGAQLSSAT